MYPGNYLLLILVKKCNLIIIYILNLFFLNKEIVLFFLLLQLFYFHLLSFLLFFDTLHSFSTFISGFDSEFTIFAEDYVFLKKKLFFFSLIL